MLCSFRTKAGNSNKHGFYVSYSLLGSSPDIIIFFHNYSIYL